MAKGITNRQMVFILLLTLATYTTINIATTTARTAGRSGWILIVLISFVFAAAAYMITALNNMYQGKMLFEYGRQIIGKWLTYGICFYYMVYFVLIGVYLKLQLANLIMTNFLPQTPHSIILAFGILLFGYVAYRGLLTIARMFEIIGVFFLVVTVAICIFMIVEGMGANILPFYNPNDASNFPKAAMALVIPYGGIEILLLIPFTPINKNAPRIALVTLAAIGLIYVLIVESTMMILGFHNTTLLSDSFIEAVKLAEVPVIERTDIFYLTFGLMGLFAGLIIIYTAIVEYACRIFPMFKRLTVVCAVGILIFGLLLLLENMSITRYKQQIDSVVTYLVMVSSLLIPAVLFAVAKIRGRTAQGSRP